MKKQILLIMSLLAMSLSYGQHSILYFDFNSSNLRLNDKSKLDELIEKFRTGNEKMICITGHTDTVGDDRFNMELSKRRVETIRNYLVSNGIDTRSVREAYNGENKPLQAANIYNRRVEVFFENQKPATTLNDFHKRIHPETETFILDPKQDHQLEGRKGIRVRIPAGSFVDSKGREVKDAVRFELVEYTSVSDLVAGRLFTQCQGNLLISEGAVQMKAYSGKSELTLKKGTTLELDFPKSSNEKFYTFYGDRAADSSVAWRQDSAATRQRNDPNKTGAYLTTWYNLSLDRARIADSLNSRMVFDSQTGLFKVLSDSEMIDLARKRAGWSQLSIEQRKIQEQNLIRLLNEQANFDTNAVKYYQTISSARLNYVNCDRFPSNNSYNPVVNFTVKLPGKEYDDGKAILIFKNYKSVMELYRVSDGSFLLNARLPVNEPVILYVTMRSSDKVFTYSKEVVLQKENKSEARLSEDTFEGMAQFLKKF